MKNNLIIIFMKAPVPGMVKTRLGKDIGFEEACLVYKDFCRKIYKEALKTGIRVEVHYYPEEGSHLIKDNLGEDILLFPQKGGDLGEKMKNSFIFGFEKGYENIILTGSDIPEMDSSLLLSAFENIKTYPVIGPCQDGGYYLIGFNSEKFDTSFFQGIEWSTERVLKDTIDKMSSENISPFLLKELDDIDNKADYEKFLKRNIL